MNLHRSRLARFGKLLAPVLSHVVTRVPGLYTVTRALCAYLNFLIGRGCGAGWDLTPEVRVASSLIFREDAVVFDVGANVGEWSRQFRVLKKDAFIFQFEPQPACCDAIRALNLPRTELVSAAVGAMQSTATLYSSQATDQSASLHQRKDSFVSSVPHIELTTNVLSLDAFTRERKIEYVDYVKLDIEGHEFFAIQGCAELMATNRIGCVAFEFGSGNINSRTYFRDFWDLFRARSFELFRIVPSGYLLPCRSYYEDEEFFRGVSNYVAISKHARSRSHTLPLIGCDSTM
jgi:FkbM family methyltransferase